MTLPARTGPHLPESDRSDAASPIVPRTMGHLPPLERLVLSMIRHVAAGKGLSALAALIAEAFEDNELRADSDVGFARHAHAVAAGLDDPDGPDINVHRIPCHRVAEDELTVLRLLAAAQANDTVSARLYAGCLVSAGRVGQLLEQAGHFVRAIGADGHRFSLDPTAPRLSWPPLPA